MAWCHEFGVVVGEGCAAPVVAGASSCSCPECGVECGGRFASCADVWAAGPRHVAVRGPAPAQAAAAKALPPATLVASLLDHGDHDDHRHAAEPSAETRAAVADVLAWMVGAVDDLRSELRQVAEALAAQQEALERLTAGGAAAGAAPDDRQPLLVAELRSLVEAAARRDAVVTEALQALPARLAGELAARGVTGEAATTARIAALAEHLPNRLGAAIAAAIEGRQEAYLARVEQVSTGLDSALGAVREVVVDLRAEVDRSRRSAAPAAPAVVGSPGGGAAATTTLPA